MGRGHRLQFVDRVASPVMLQVDPEDGTVLVAGDPKAGRHAAALEEWRVKSGEWRVENDE